MHNEEAKKTVAQNKIESGGASVINSGIGSEKNEHLRKLSQQLKKKKQGSSAVPNHISVSKPQQD